MASVGSMLGTKALQIFDETTCVVRAVRRWTQFYAHESCGKCTPCREGTYWLAQIYARLETGAGTRTDIDKLLDIADGVHLVLRLFGGLARPLPCDGATLADGGNAALFDLNGDAGVNVSDAVHLLGYLFKAGPAPARGTSCVRVVGCPQACGG